MHSYRVLNRAASARTLLLHITEGQDPALARLLQNLHISSVECRNTHLPCQRSFAKELKVSSTIDSTAGLTNNYESRIPWEARMSWLLSYLTFFKPPRPVPPVVSTDEVVPVHLFDDTTTLRDIGMVWTFRFKEVLDPDKLNAALSSLFRKDGWRKLGGRFRRKVGNSSAW